MPMRLLFTLLCLAAWVRADVPESELKRKTFHVRQCVEGAVYLDGGSSHGLAEGMRLVIERKRPEEAGMAARKVAEVVVVAVASQSAYAEIRDRDADLEPQAGDDARISMADAEVLERAQAARARRRYVQRISFTNGDPLEEEVREYVPMAPPSEVGRLRGRIGVEFSQLADRASGLTTHQEALVARIDWTRIEGSYWNLSGYWRGRWSTRNSEQSTLVDLINRTYTLGLTYDNPRSPYQMGFGRLLLPWASSLNTLDGGYLARRFKAGVTTGVFAGTTPNPVEWNYDPNRQMLGLFANFGGGSYETSRWSSTVGAAVTRVHWRPERNFLFLENSLFLGPRFSILHNLEADLKNPRLMDGQRGAMLSRSFLSLRFQPSDKLSFDVGQNYFRGLPTFDTALLGTGLLDKYLFQGLTAGFRATPIERLILSATIGNSHKDGDTRSSINQSYGVAWTRLPWLQTRADARFTRYSSSFGNGQHESLSFSRQIGSGLRLDLMGGRQRFQGALTSMDRSYFINGQAEWNVGRHSFLSAGYLSQWGRVVNYRQIFLTVGYRF